MLQWIREGVESGEGILFRLLRMLLLAAGLVWAACFVVLSLEWKAQTILGILLVSGALLVGRTSRSAKVTMALMVLSVLATMRYAWWRIGASISFLRNPSNAWDWVDAACIVILLSAETYAFVILLLGFMQTIWPLKRPPVPLPSDHTEWPHVDLLIPTYNEPLSVVKYTAMASLNIDWPADKLHIYILDDGHRDEFRCFAQEAGIGYMTRDDNKHAKAGNINRALERLDSPYVAIFDCDHLPTRSFLQVTMGWFLREQRLAMVQTPHHFYSADPFERNLKQFRLIPNEGELFYGVVQDGNDLWNATFFCGSCAVLRRTALDEIGGIAVETVTEDAHTSLRMQMNGWNTAYINIPQAAGLATERLSGHIQQRIRWARGMIQILRTDNPLFAKGLKLPQRICYFNAMTHFLYALPRLIFLTAPLVYLFFSRSNVPGYWAAILAYALPHLVLSNVTNSRIQGQHRHSFWNEIYETVLAPYILLPTLTALINPKLGKFNVTAKGGFVEETYFDRKIAKPFIVLLNLNVAGLLMVLPRLVHLPYMQRFWDGTHPGTIAMNALWCCFNIIILGVAITVAREEIQRREQVRIDFVLPARVRLATGELLSGHSTDISISGIALEISKRAQLTAGDLVTLLLPLRVGDAELPCTIVGNEGQTLRLHFEDLSTLQEEMLTTILYSRADAWLGWDDTREVDRPLRSLYRIIKLSLGGLWSTFGMAFSSKEASREKKIQKPVTHSSPAAGRVVPLVLLGLALGLIPRLTPAQTTGSTFRTNISLKELGVLDAIELRGADSYRSIPFSLPRDQVADRATLHLIYRFSPLAPSSTRLRVFLNGTTFATLRPSPADGNHGAVTDEILSVPAELLVRNNQLTFEFSGTQDKRCNDVASDPTWGELSPASSFDIFGERISIASNLKELPLPLLDPAITRQRVIPLVLDSNPSATTLRAAGVVASYFGMVADYPVPRFPVSLVTLPPGNAVLIANGSSDLVAELHVGPVMGPTVALRPNPQDPFGTVLIITGEDDNQLLLAAQALALGASEMEGTTFHARDIDLPPSREADDAPRWAAQKVALWSAADTERSSDGSTPLELFLRVPPDLDYTGHTHLNLHLDYRYRNAAPSSSLLIRLNGYEVASMLLHHNKNLVTPTQADVPLPVSSLRPFSNSLYAQWLLDTNDASHCTLAAPANFQGSILQSSFLDLRGIPHFISLPNLELFSNAGFPFTRYADLSRTMVILPAQPTPQEIEVYLTLLADFSAQTGYPALRVSVGTAADMQSGADEDLLVIGTSGTTAGLPDNAAIAFLNEHLPVAILGRQLRIPSQTDLRARLRSYRDEVLGAFGKTPADFDLQQLPDAIFEGLESPFASKRSIVVLELNSSTVADAFLNSFLDASHSSDISGDVSVLQSSSFHSYRVSHSTYSLGQRSWYIALLQLFTAEPWSLVLGLLLFSLICAGRMQTLLERKSRTRLHLSDDLA